MINKSIASIAGATILFVTGQIFLKKSFLKDDNFHYTASIFGIFIGISAVLYMVYHHSIMKLDKEKTLFAALAGIAFFFGNLLWIYSISTKTQLGNIRTIMAGFEMILLFCVGILIFNDQLKYTQGLGVALILLGIYIVSYSM